MIDILDSKSFRKDQTFSIKEGPNKTGLQRAFNLAFSFHKKNARETAHSKLADTELKEVDVIIVELGYDREKPRPERFHFKGEIKCDDKKVICIKGTYNCKQSKGQFTVQ